MLNRSLPTRVMPLATALGAALAALGAGACEALADRSLPQAEYEKLGVPAPTQNWTPAEHKQAVQALVKLAQSSPQQLPRFQSPRSGVIFAKLISPHPGFRPTDRAQRFEDRFQKSLSRLQSNSQILDAYVKAANALPAGGRLGRELTELMGASLEATAHVLSLLDELVPRLDPNDPSYPARLRGLAQMRGGVAQTLSGVITSLTEPVYTARDRARLVELAETWFPALGKQLTKEAAAETVRRLRELGRDGRLGALGPRLITLSRQIKPSPDPFAPPSPPANP